MFSQNKISDFFVRMALGMAIGCLFGWILSSFGGFFVTEVDTGQRDPQQITIQNKDNVPTVVGQPKELKK